MQVAMKRWVTPCWPWKVFIKHNVLILPQNKKPSIRPTHTVKRIILLSSYCHVYVWYLVTYTTKMEAVYSPI